MHRPQFRPPATGQCEGPIAATAGQRLADDQLARGHQRDAEQLLCGRARLHPEQWLLIEWPAGDAEPPKYFLSNLPADTAINDMVASAHLRWRIERDYQDLKQELGLGHYEGRGWRGFHHHAALSIAAYGFLVAERLAADRAVGAKKNFIVRQVPALPADYIPRGSPARAAARTKLHRNDPPSAQCSTHPSPRPLSALRAAKRKTTLVTQ